MDYHRNLTKINFIYFCARFHMYIHAYALLLQSRGLTLVQISAIESVVIFTVFVMEVPTGVLADRIGRKKSIAAALFLMMCAELLFFFAQVYPLYLLMAVMTGMGFAFNSGATEALIYDSLPDDETRDQRMKQAMGRYGSIGQIAFFLAPLVGALVLGDLTAGRFQIAIALTVSILLIGFGMALTLHEPPTPWRAERQNARQILQGGWREIRGKADLRQWVWLVIFTTPFTGMMITTFSAPYMRTSQVVPWMIGVALSVGSLGAAFTQRYAYRLEEIVGPRTALHLLIFVPSVAYGLLAAFTSPVMVWVLVTLMYATNDAKTPLISAYQNQHIASDHRATTLSFINMLVNLYVALLGPLYALIGMQSLRLAFGVMGGVILVGGLLFRIRGR